MLKKYNYRSLAAQIKMIFFAWALLFMILLSIFLNEGNPLASEIVSVFTLLLFGVGVSIATFISLKRTYIEITDNGIRFNGLRKKVYSPWQGVREIKILGRKHKIYTINGNFSIGYLVEPADIKRQSYFGLLKTAGKYSEELIEEVKKMATHVKISYSIFLRPL